MAFRFNSVVFLTVGGVAAKNLFGDFSQWRGYCRCLRQVGASRAEAASAIPKHG